MTSESIQGKEDMSASNILICCNCGKELEPSSFFCNVCGCRLEGENGQPRYGNADGASAVLRAGKRTAQRRRKIHPALLALRLAPLIAAIAAAAAIYFSYSYEHGIDMKVEAMKEEAESLILEGNFTKAEYVISEALKLRPRHNTLNTDKDIIKKGESISQILSEADSLIREQKYNDALVHLKKAEKGVQSGNEVFSGLFLKIIENKKDLIGLMQLKHEASDGNNVLQLGPIYKIVLAMESQDAQAVSEEIYGRIKDISVKDAKRYLEEKSYDMAVYVIDTALRYISDSAELAAMKNDALSRKSSFENIMKARASAIIRNEGIKSDNAMSVEYSISFNRNGYMVIEGIVANKGSSDLYDIFTTFLLYDEMGNVIDTVEVEYPGGSLAPDSKGSISYTYVKSAGVKLAKPSGFKYTSSSKPADTVSGNAAGSGGAGEQM
jgi:tetratricopeptide (TPR) repeat protein